MKTPRLLKPDEISCRVQQVTDSAGAIILLYKDARVDMNILDETYGAMNWKREHHTIDGNLFCTISIWDEDKAQWVSKQDVGVESATEATKGEASDAFKRAGFNWGIGRELYTGPFIFVQLVGDEVKRNSMTGKNQATFKFGLTVKSITYNENREIEKLVLVDKKGKVRFEHGSKANDLLPAEPQDKTPEKTEAKVTIVTTQEIKERNNILKALLKDKGKTMEEYKEIAGDISVANIDKEAFEALLIKLQKAWA